MQSVFSKKRGKSLHEVAYYTLGETENEWQKTEPVPILLLRGARSFFDAKKKVDFLYLSNFVIVGYGHFPTRNGLKF